MGILLIEEFHISRSPVHAAAQITGPDQDVNPVNGVLLHNCSIVCTIVPKKLRDTQFRIILFHIPLTTYSIEEDKEKER